VVGKTVLAQRSAGTIVDTNMGNPFLILEEVIFIVNAACFGLPLDLVCNAKEGVSEGVDGVDIDYRCININV
jgi:hypothetical protein